MYRRKSFSIKTWSKIGVEVTKHNGKRWINERHLEIALSYKNIVGKTQYCSDELKKRRCEIQDCEDCQSWRKFIAEKLAVHLIIDIKTAKTGELKINLGFNQLDPIMNEQESKSLRTRKTFSIEEIIQDFYIKKFDYMINVHSPKKSWQ